MPTDFDLAVKDPEVRVHALIWLLVGAGSLYFARGDAWAGLMMVLGLSMFAAFMAAGISRYEGFWSWAAGMAYAIVAVPAICLLYVIAAYVSQRGPLGQVEVRAVAQTYASEAAAYLATLVGWRQGLLAVAGGALLIMSFPRPKSAVRNSRKPLPDLLPGILIGMVLLFFGFQTYFGPFIASLDQYKAEVRSFDELAKRRRAAPITGASTDFEGTVVLVVGESTSRHHMGIYGYWRDTTPTLEERRKSLILFEDVVSPHSHTVQALMSAFTSSGSSAETDYFSPNSIDIISLARAAGFKTFWVSNQNEYGLWDNPVSLLGKGSESAEFISSSFGRSFARTRPDRGLLDRLEHVLDHDGSRRKLVVLHLFATHFPYCANFSTEEQAFTEPLGPAFWGQAVPRPDVNCYDDSVREVDRILSRVMNDADASDQPISILYFSDHGEAPLLGTGHESVMYSSYHVEVPFLLYANRAFRDQRAALVARALENRSASYDFSRLYHSLAELMGIQHSSVDRTSSIFSGFYSPRARVLMGGAVGYDQWGPHNDYRRNTFLALRAVGDFSSAVWAHRVDSIGALLEAKRTFSGVEMDVVFHDDCRCFKVYHPPARDNGLRLETALQAAKDKPDLKLWFDWKNPSKASLPDALVALEELDRLFSIRNRALIETAPDAVFTELRGLSQRGFRHGYYVPTEAVMEVMTGSDPQAIRAMATQVKSALDIVGANAITFDWRLNEFVRGELNQVIPIGSLELFSWDQSIDLAKDEQAPAMLARRIAENRLSALLVPFRSVFWY